MKERVLALDYGEKRIGVAVSDPLGMTAQPRSFITNNKDKITLIKDYIEENDIKKIIVGMPLAIRGGRSKKCDEIDEFMITLKKELTIPIDVYDERFSTVGATRQLHEVGMNQKKQRKIIDSMAAAFMLQGYLDKES